MPRWIWYIVNPFQALLCFLWTMSCIVAVWICLVLGAQRRLHFRVARHPWATVILGLVGARVEKVGFTDPTPGAKLYVANHQTVIDIPVLVHSLPIPLYFIAKRELFRFPVFGWYIRAIGMVPVDRRGGANARLDLSRFTAETEGGVIAFAEGTRSRDGRVGEFKRGAFAAAIEAGIPVVPFAIENAANVVGRAGFTGRPGKIRIHQGREIPTEGLGPRDRAALARQARAEILRLLGEPEGADASAAQVGGAVDVDDTAGGKRTPGVGQE